MPVHILIDPRCIKSRGINFGFDCALPKTAFVYLLRFVSDAMVAIGLEGRNLWDSSTNTVESPLPSTRSRYKSMPNAAHRGIKSTQTTAGPYVPGSTTLRPHPGRSFPFSRRLIHLRSLLSSRLALCTHTPALRRSPSASGLPKHNRPNIVSYRENIFGSCAVKAIRERVL